MATGKDPTHPHGEQRVGEVDPLRLSAFVNSEPVTLEEWRGEMVLLLFWNIGCAGCTGRALPFSRELAARFPSLRLMAIHSVFGFHAEQPVEQVRQVVEYFKLPYPVALDEGDSTFRAYGAEGTPHWILLDENGAVHRSIFGSMEGARQRLEYALMERIGPGIASPPGRDDVQ